MAAEDFPNDKVYERWRVANPAGFILNTNRSHSSSHTKLHRATCRILEQWARTCTAGELTGEDYHKVGSLSPREAMSWLHRRRSDSEATYCHICCADRIEILGGDSVGDG